MFRMAICGAALSWVSTNGNRYMASVTNQFEKPKQKQCLNKAWIYNIYQHAEEYAAKYLKNGRVSLVANQPQIRNKTSIELDENADSIKPVIFKITGDFGLINVNSSKSKFGLVDANQIPSNVTDLTISGSHVTGILPNIQKLELNRPGKFDPEIPESVTHMKITNYIPRDSMIRQMTMSIYFGRCYNHNLHIPGLKCSNLGEAKYWRYKIVSLRFFLNKTSVLNFLGCKMSYNLSSTYYDNNESNYRNNLIPFPNSLKVLYFNGGGWYHYSHLIKGIKPDNSIEELHIGRQIHPAFDPFCYAKFNNLKVLSVHQSYFEKWSHVYWNEFENKKKYPNIKITVLLHCTALPQLQYYKGVSRIGYDTFDDAVIFWNLNIAHVATNEAKQLGPNIYTKVIQDEIRYCIDLNNFILKESVCENGKRFLRRTYFD